MRISFINSTCMNKVHDSNVFYFVIYNKSEILLSLNINKTLLFVFISIKNKKYVFLSI